MPKTLILGHHGGANLGDDFMLEGLLRLLPETGIDKVQVVAKDCDLIEPMLAGRATAVPFSPRKVLSALRSCDQVVLGGGTHFADSYHGLRLIRHYRYISRYLGLFLIARMLGKRVTLLGMGFGPLRLWPTRILTRLGLGLSDAVTVRDRASMDDLSRWQMGNKVQLAPDLAGYLLTPPLEDTACTGQPARVGVSLTATEVMANIIGEEAAAQFWKDAFVAFEEAYRATPDTTWDLVVFRGGQREDDTGVTRELYDRLAGIDSTRVRLVPYSAQTDEMADAIRACDVFIATRFHAAVSAFLSRNRLLFIDYDRKVGDFAREIGLNSRFVVPIDQPVDVEQVASLMQTAITGDGWPKPEKTPEDYVQGTERHSAALGE